MTYPPQGPGPYQQPMYYPPQPKGKSVASLVIGIISLFFGFTFLLPIIGLILGLVGASKEPAGRGLAIGGIVLNLICLAGWIIVLIIMGLVGVALFASTSSSGVFLLGA